MIVRSEKSPPDVGGLLFSSLSMAFSSDFFQISGRIRKETEAFGNMRLLRKPKYDIVILVRKEKSEKRDGMRKKETKREKKRKK